MGDLDGAVEFVENLDFPFDRLRVLGVGEMDHPNGGEIVGRLIESARNERSNVDEPFFVVPKLDAVLFRRERPGVLIDVRRHSEFFELPDRVSGFE